ncbi:MAG: DoxX family protein [Acidobacteria bacterium]|nr:MAG: DoxX family protein [Acidobacteriota bacterium]
MNIALWIIQVLLSLLFLFAGSTKFVMPVEEMNRQAPVVLPGLLLHFIGACEILGGLGLILPGLLRIKPGLTPLAAAGLAIITLGATVITIKGGAIVMAVFPFVVCLLSIFVAYSRWRVAPIAPR